MAALPHFASTHPAHEDPFDASAPADAARFCVYHPAAGSPRGLVVHVHALAEEMNKSRRMASMQSQALAAAGWAVLQADLLGCGDSACEFGEATWNQWLDDVAWAVTHLQRLSGADPATPLWLWGHRVGALLAAQAAQTLAERSGLVPNLLLWQPTGSGKMALQQFLRLKAAAEMLDGGAKGVTESLKRELAEGRPVEVAGYLLNTGLAQGLEAATLAPPPRPARAVWIEVASGEAPELLPASRVAVERWQAAGWRVEAAAVAGPAFWQTTEIEDAPALVQRTVQALCQPAELEAAR